MLPKDYLAYRLSGSFCTDVSDASGMLLLDVKTAAGQKKCLRSAISQRNSFRSCMKVGR